MRADDLDAVNRNETPVIIEQGYLPTHRAAFSLFNGTVGAALLNLPYVYYRFGGWQAALMIQTVIAAVICGSFIIIAIGTHKSGVNNFFDLTEYYISPVVSVILQFYAVIVLFGASVAFVIILKDQVSAGLLGFFKLPDAWYAGDKFITFILSLLLFYPFILPKKLTAIGYVSLMGLVATAYLTIAIIAKYYIDGPVDKNYKPKIKIDWDGAFQTIGAVVFAFQNHIPSVTVFHEMKSIRLSRYILASVISTTLCHIVYLVFGIYGSLSFGSLIKDDIFLNYKHNDTVIAVGRAMLVVVLLTSYAVTGHSARIALHKLLGSFWRRCKSCVLTKPNVVIEDDDLISIVGSDDEENNDEALIAKASLSNYPNLKAWLISGTMWFLLSYMLAMFTPGISTALGYLGSAATMYTMVIPGVCLVRIILNEREKHILPLKLFCYFIGVLYVAMGVFICVIALYENIKI